MTSETQSITKPDFPWNDNELVDSVYNNKKNYKIIKTKAKTGKIIVFFSSNAIYYPNDEETFTKRIIEEDYYDWTNISKHKLIRKNFEKIVFVRDVYKQWYVKGINKDINDINSLIGLVKSITKGYKVTTVGSSAGGYIASLVGCQIGAERIINNSGQYNLDKCDNLGPFIEKYSNDENKSKYYDIVPYIKENSSRIYYFYPSSCEYDIIQSSLTEGLHINYFAMDSTKHGEAIRPVCYPYVITLNKEKLNRLCSRSRADIVKEKYLYKMVVPINIKCFLNIKKKLKRILSVVKKNKT